MQPKGAANDQEAKMFWNEAAELWQESALSAIRTTGS